LSETARLSKQRAQPSSETTSVPWPRFIELVRAHKRFLLTSHVRPDCDALGSELGLAGVLEALGKEAMIVNAQKTPPNLAFIDPEGRLKTLGVDVEPFHLEGCEVLLVLDTSAWAQLGAMADVVRASKAKKAILDHHLGEDDLGAELFKDPKAEATGRLVFEAARHLGVRITPEIARPLFAAIATDTGWFRFASTTGTTLRYAGELVEAGAVPSEIYASLYEQDTLARLKLRGRILARTVTDLDGRLAHTAALKEDFEATGALLSDTEDVINLTLAIAGTEVAVILVEQPSGSFKISFRSRTPHVDCSELAKSFGGGGHKAAAGASIDAPFPEAQRKVLDAVRRAMR
jgi:phosphoesterase RecJ-like protein